MKTSMALYVVFLSSPITFFLNDEAAKNGLQALLRHLVNKAVITFSFHCYRKQLDERNKEFYDLKVESATKETSLREALLRIKELESSLKNEVNYYQSVAHRYQSLYLSRLLQVVCSNCAG